MRSQEGERIVALREDFKRVDGRCANLVNQGGQHAGTETSGGCVELRRATRVGAAGPRPEDQALVRRARVVLLAAVGYCDAEIAEQVPMDLETVGGVALKEIPLEEMTVTNRLALTRRPAEHDCYALRPPRVRSGDFTAAADADRVSLDELLRHLTASGYEPYADAASVRLRNCPFDSPAQQFASTGLCAMSGNCWPSAC